MSNLIVVGFKKDMFRASQVLNQLSALDADWVIELRDAVTVYRDYSGKLRVDQTYITTGEGAAWGGLWGSLIGLTLAIPFTAGASAAAAAGALAAGALGGGALGAATGALDVEFWRDTVGISEDFISEVGALVQPGDSAIFVLVRRADPAYVADQFRGFGGTVLRSTLTQEQTERVQAVLDGKKPTASYAREALDGAVAKLWPARCPD
jgi:uncharacterized membrane protein